MVMVLLFSSMLTATASAYSRGDANGILNQTSNYLGEVNESGYIIFYPNMTSPYSYLSDAYNALNASPDQAVAYANMSMGAAQEQYNRISAYKSESLVVMALLTLISAAVFYAFVMPSRSAPKRSRKT